jgi:hypothetical protein
MAAFARSRDWVVPGDSSLSRLYKEFDTGPMRILDSADIIKRWIDTGAATVEAGVAPEAGAVPMAALSVREHSGAYVAPKEEIVAAPVVVAPSVRTARRDFAAKRKLIGMGAVH